jgi:hypothetical protein
MVKVRKSVVKAAHPTLASFAGSLLITARPRNQWMSQQFVVCGEALSPIQTLFHRSRMARSTQNSVRKAVTKIEDQANQIEANLPEMKHGSFAVSERGIAPGY